MKTQLREYIEAGAPPIGMGELAERRAALPATQRAGDRTRWPSLRPGRARWVVVAAVAASAALAGGALQLTGATSASHRPSALATKHGPAKGTPSSRSTSPYGTAPASLTAMVVVSRRRAFANIGLVSSGSAFLTCVSRLVCYAEGQKGSRPEVVRTDDGGVTWQAGQLLPALSAQMRGWDGAISCLTPLRCVTGYGAQILTTTDGFARVSFRRIVSRGNQVGDATCATPRACVADVIGGSRITLIYSRDGGRTWTSSAGPALPATDTIVQLRCDGDGRCVALISAGDEENDQVAALGSTDGGRSWALSRVASLGTAQWIRFSCGSGQDCVYTDNAGGLAWVHVSAAGQVRVTVLKRAGNGLTGVYQAVSCPTGPRCYAEVSDLAGASYTGTVLVVTHDSGRTWASLGSPMVTGMPDAIIVYLGCPVAAGCIGLGSNGRQSGNNWLVFSNLHNHR